MNVLNWLDLSIEFNRKLNILLKNITECGKRR